MKAALCKSLDGPTAIELADLPDPEPGPGEAVVGVRAAALNFLDTLIVRGRYQTRPALPFSAGAEMAGVVERLGAGHLKLLTTSLASSGDSAPSLAVEPRRSSSAPC